MVYFSAVQLDFLNCPNTNNIRGRKRDLSNGSTRVMVDLPVLRTGTDPVAEN